MNEQKQRRATAGKYQDLKSLFVSQEKKDSSTKKLSAGGGAKKKYRANQLLF